MVQQTEQPATAESSVEPSDDATPHTEQQDEPTVSDIEEPETDHPAAEQNVLNQEQTVTTVTEKPSDTEAQNVEYKDSEVEIPMRSTEPITIPKSTRSYYDIQNSRSTPAYKRRQYKLITEIQGKGNVIKVEALNDDDATAEVADSTTLKLF